VTHTATTPSLVIIGAGPGGYPAAYLAADYGMEVTLIDKDPNPGGVCLYRGCIPSKALLHVSNILNDANSASEWGVQFDSPKIHLPSIRKQKDKIVSRLTNGLGAMAKQRNVTFMQGTAKFLDESTVRVSKTGDEPVDFTFDYAIISTGSHPSPLPGLDITDPRIMDSTSALELDEIPQSLLVIGGGYIGLELGSVYSALGSDVTVVEMANRLLPEVDPDLVKPLQSKLETTFTSILLETSVEDVSNDGDRLSVVMRSILGETTTDSYDKILVAVGRKPFSADLGLEMTNVKIDQNGFIDTNAQCKTAHNNIYAIGDVAGNPMLAHKATAEARIAIESIQGMTSSFDPAAIPAIVFTDPEIAWAGLTESQAKAKGISVETISFPWIASGRAMTVGHTDGLTKLVVEPSTQRVLGVGVVGYGAGELIGEGVLAIEMGSRVEDIALSIHPHPTLSETISEAAHLFFGHNPHYIQRK
tara:strand:+ start:1077 stop:2498 length:1422 start_codon:yes stop_codon:yes gene_type:complete